MPTDAITLYLSEVQRQLGTGQAGEHSYRPALKTLIESFDTTIVATNEPKRVRCGAPDFIVTRGEIPLGYLEAKDIGKNLNHSERTEQMRRYLDSLGNLILTDYLEFRWYLNGQIRMAGRLARVSPTGKLQRDPEGPKTVSRLVKDFLSAKAPSIGSYKELAARMAAIARLLREIITKAFQDEDKGGSLHTQLQAFKKVLLQNLEPGSFADMYAQTITYGLLAALFNHDRSKHGDFNRRVAAYDIPKTNPFLIEMFDYFAGPRLDDRLAWAVDHLAELLNAVDIRALKQDFQKLTGKKDPVYHLYETFLAAYDPTLRQKKGVYYTPQPVVSYIVRSVDHILKKDFGLADGLADTAKIRLEDGSECHKVLILDPACGTGTFLHGVIDHIHKHLVSKGQAGLWPGYVSEHLLPRLFGFELQMAPYTVAHMKLGLKLQQTGYDFRSGERLRIYLTNALEKARKSTEPELFANLITKEANAASEVKADKPVMVIIGNPPYLGHSENKGEWITGLIEDYKRVDGEKLRLGQAKWLQNDYVKFIRFAQHKIMRTGYGILAMITDHSYIDSGTFVGMRASLQASFDKIYALDLHGNAKKNRNRTDLDQNVFDITQGVCILIAVRSHRRPRSKYVATYGDTRGPVEAKERFLESKSVSDIGWRVDPSQCKPPFYLFVSSDWSHLEEYEAHMDVRDVLPGAYAGEKANRIGTGFVSTQDDFAISFSVSEMRDKIRSFLSTSSESEARSMFRLCSQSQWNYQRAKAGLAAANWEGQIRKVLYRPFDWRFTVWNRNVCVHRRARVHNHLREDNIVLCVGQAGNVIGFDDWDLAFVSAFPVDFNCFYRGGCAALPLYLYPDGPLPNILFEHQNGRRPNFSKEFVLKLCKALNTPYHLDQAKAAQDGVTAASVFYYIYAFLYSRRYRERYSRFLMIDFPHVPIPPNVQVFQELAALGEELVGLHTMTKQAPVHTRFEARGDNCVEKVRYTEPGQGAEIGRVWINKTQFFENVPLEIWNFHIGGYQVCHKWLKDRKGRFLTYDDLVHYQRVISALGRTIELMSDIDQVIESHGALPLR